MLGGMARPDAYLRSALANLLAEIFAGIYHVAVLNTGAEIFPALKRNRVIPEVLTGLPVAGSPIPG